MTFNHDMMALDAEDHFSDRYDQEPEMNDDDIDPWPEDEDGLLERAIREGEIPPF